MEESKKKRKGEKLKELQQHFSELKEEVHEHTYELVQLRRQVTELSLQVKASGPTTEAGDKPLNAGNPDELKLCYVCPRTGAAWFTSCPLDLIWGDDWNDAPYEHNAGDPYEDHYEGEGMDRKRVPHTLMKAFWDSPGHESPNAGMTNTSWSVKDINGGAVAWLTPARYCSNPGRPIYAGTSLEEFIRLVEATGGEVYLPRRFRE